jgi:hypothetical protein
VRDLKHVRLAPRAQQEILGATALTNLNADYREFNHLRTGGRIVPIFANGWDLAKIVRNLESTLAREAEVTIYCRDDTTSSIAVAISGFGLPPVANANPIVHWLQFSFPGIFVP